MKKNTSGFSFVEMIIAVSILLLLTVIGVSVNSNYKEKSLNVRIVSDLESLSNGCIFFKKSEGVLPLPGGNKSFFSQEASYVHDESDGNAFGVTGYITSATLPKKIIDTLPVDPRTNQYYGYAKTLDNDGFELSGVIKEGGRYISKVTGNYTNASPRNLIRSYNSPDFVFDGSKSAFPYNPEERVLSGKISSFSGSVTINESISGESILSYELRQGDSVQVSVGGNAIIHFSDGSVSTLGDSFTESELYIAQLDLKEETNLVTKVQLALSIGSIWTQASQLGDDSEFEVYTTDTTAAVRGTIFGIQKNPVATNLTVQIGKIKVAKLPSTIADFDSLTATLNSGTLLEGSLLTALGITTSGEEDGQTVSYIESDGTLKGVSISSSGNTSAKIIPPHIEEDFSNIYTPSLLSIGKENGVKTIKLSLAKILTPTFLKEKNIVLKIHDIYAIPAFSITSSIDNKNIVTLNESSLFEDTDSRTELKNIIQNANGKISIKLCLKERCTIPLYLNIPNGTLSETISSQDIIVSQEEIENECPLSFMIQEPGSTSPICIENPLKNIPYKLVGYAPGKFGNPIFYSENNEIKNFLSSNSGGSGTNYIFSTSTAFLKESILGFATEIKISHAFINTLTTDIQLLKINNTILKINKSRISVYKDGTISSPNPDVIINFPQSIVTSGITSEQWYSLIFKNEKGKTTIDIYGENNIPQTASYSQAITSFNSLLSEIKDDKKIKDLKIFTKVNPLDVSSRDYIRRVGTILPTNTLPEIQNISMTPPAPLTSTNIYFNVTATDTDGDTLTYTWKDTSGTILGNNLLLTKSISTPGSYTYTVYVSDGKSIVSQSRSFIVSSNTPIAKILPVADITLPINFITLDGTTSTNATQYLWSKVSGPGTPSIDTNTLGKAKITGLQSGTYTYKLVVKNSAGITSIDINNTVTFTVISGGPTVNVSQSKIVNNVVTLDGNGSKDGNGGTNLTYTWTKSSTNPSGGIIVTPLGKTTTIKDVGIGLPAGNYEYKYTLTVKDNSTLQTKTSGNILIKVMVASSLTKNGKGCGTCPAGSQKNDGTVLGLGILGNPDTYFCTDVRPVGVGEVICKEKRLIGWKDINWSGTYTPPPTITLTLP